jgi:hypothetical protein
VVRKQIHGITRPWLRKHAPPGPRVGTRRQLWKLAGSCGFGTVIIRIGCRAAASAIRQTQSTRHCWRNQEGTTAVRAMYAPVAPFGNVPLSFPDSGSRWRSDFAQQCAQPCSPATSPTVSHPMMDCRDRSGALPRATSSGLVSGTSFGAIRDGAGVARSEPQMRRGISCPYASGRADPLRGPGRRRAYRLQPASHEATRRQGMREGVAGGARSARTPEWATYGRFSPMTSISMCERRRLVVATSR